MSTASAAETTTLGMTGREVSRIAFGTWQLGGDWWGSFDEAEAIRRGCLAGPSATSSSSIAISSW